MRKQYYFIDFINIEWILSKPEAGVLLIIICFV